MGKLLKLLIVAAIFIYGKSYAQTLKLDAYIQEARVGLVDEFMNRFNGQAFHPDLKEDGSSLLKKNLLSLFDISSCSGDFVEASAMVDAAIANTTKLNFSDSTWVAVALCNGILDKKTVKFRLYLTVQHRMKNMYKWVISKAEGACFDVEHPYTKKQMIMPDDHETKFMSLHRITTEQPFNVELFMSSKYKYDATSAFVYLVHSKRLKINFVEDLEFVFLQIPGYAFHVRYFERESSNAGWLISKFYRFSDREKRVMLNSLNVYQEKHIPTYKGYAITDKDIVNADSTSYNKNVFKMRINERLAVLFDYLNYIRDSKNNNIAYSDCLKELFVPNTVVHLRKMNNPEVQKISLDELFKIIIKDNCKIKIDALSVPQWNDSITSVRSDVATHSLSVSAVLLSFDDDNKYMYKPYNQTLYVCKEDTEDGVEWLPKFGDLYITVK